MGGVAWTREEDQLLRACIERHGEGKWHRIPLLAGLNRCRKSCRLRWLNYLRPNIKRGNFTNVEVEHIIELHKVYGNKWSLIARKLPGRTSNDVKNYWNCHLSKRLNSHHVFDSTETTQSTTLLDDDNNIQCESRDFDDWKTTQNTMEMNKPWAQDEAGPSTLPKEFVQDQSHDNVNQTAADKEVHDKYSCAEEHRIMEELLSKDIIDLDDIKIRGGSDEQSVWKWDFEDLTLDVELWSDFL